MCVLGVLMSSSGPGLSSRPGQSSQPGLSSRPGLSLNPDAVAYEPQVCLSVALSP